MNHPPLISVIMPVRDGLPWFLTAVDSIVKQAFTDWELIIVDDGSSDGTVEIAMSIENDQVRFLRSPGSGLVDALNFGLCAARGRYLARMDADDIAHPNRLESQFSVLEADSNLGVVYTAVYLIDELGTLIDSAPISSAAPADLLATLTFRKIGRSIVHPSVLMRTEVVRAIGGYRHFVCAEDCDLWLRLLEVTDFAVLRKPMLSYRLTATGVSRAKAERQLASALLAVACHKVRMATGVDLYFEQPALLQILDREALRLADGISSRLVPFENMKHSVRSRRVLSAAVKVLSLAVVDPLLLLGSCRLAMHRKAAIALSDAGERLLQYGPAAGSAEAQSTAQFLANRSFLSERDGQ